MLNLETDPETLSEYERIMGLSEDVLRFMNITVDEVPEEPSIMMNNAKPERGGRGDRSSSGRNVEAHDETQMMNQMQLRNRHLKMTLRSES